MQRNNPSMTESTHWGIPMTFGVLMTLGGIFAMCAAMLTGIVSVLYIGASLAVVGVIDVVSGIQLRGRGSTTPLIAVGVLAIIAGIVLLARPLAGLASLTMLVTAYLFASGLFRGITSVADRYPGWGWDLAYSIVALLLGIYVMAWWPVSSLWVLGTVVGAEITARGASLVAASWTLRELEHDLAPAH
jgi:uncharacterized membrane protein HdeD (DUF308 family)